MKKVLFAVVSFLMLAGVSLWVEGSGLGPISFSTYPQQDKVKIKKEELPETARKTLDGEAFKGWTVDKVYKLTSGDFEVEMKKDGTSQTLKFNKEGKVK